MLVTFVKKVNVIQLVWINLCSTTWWGPKASQENYPPTCNTLETRILHLKVRDNVQPYKNIYTREREISSTNASNLYSEIAKFLEIMQTTSQRNGKFFEIHPHDEKYNWRLVQFIFVFKTEFFHTSVTFETAHGSIFLKYIKPLGKELFTIKNAIIRSSRYI